MQKKPKANYFLIWKDDHQRKKKKKGKKIVRLEELILGIYPS